MRRLAVSRARARCATAPAGYELTVLVDGVPARTYMHDGETYVLGQLGSHYTLRISNHTGRRIEAVVSVDGRDAIDGKPADWRSKRGYLVPAWGSVDIEGWRISHAQAAAFRFSSVPDSYAARTGSARDVGVIGVAVFPERYLPPRVYRVPPPRPTRIRTRTRTTTTTIAAATPTAGRAPRAKNDKAPPARRRARRRRRPQRAPPRDAAGEADSGALRQGVARSEAQPYARRNRPGLGTEYGEAVNSPSTRSSSCAPTPALPSAVLGVRYNDRDGLLAMGIPVDSYYDQACYDTTTTATCAARPSRSRSTDRRFAAPPPGWQRPCGWR